MPLSDTGLLVRYYVDEASSGTGPTQVNDASSNAYHLTEVNYGAGNMAYGAGGFGRLLESTSTTGTQRARRGINNTADTIRTGLTGAKRITFEVVVDIDSLNASNSRIFCINDRVGTAPELGLAGTDLNNVDFYWKGVAHRRLALLAPTNRVVMHIVINTSEGTAADRIRWYVNGKLESPTALANPTLDETFSFAADCDLIMFNRENAGTWDRSFDGRLAYCAIYNQAFNTVRLAEHYDLLIKGDDTPVLSNSGWFTGPAAPTLADDFNDNSRDERKWKIWRASGTANDIQEAGGVLRMDFANTTGVHYLHLLSRRRYNFLGQNISVKLVSVPGASADITLSVEVDAEFWLSWTYESGTMYAQYKVGVDPQTTVGSEAYSSTNHAFIRIRESGGTVFWERSSDGSSWNSPFSWAHSGIDLTSVHAALGGGTYTTGVSPFTGSFDDFQSTLR